MNNVLVFAELVDKFSFEVESYDENGNIVLKRLSGSLCNGCDITIRWHGGIVHRPEFGEPFNMATIEGKVWAFDGDEYEREQSFKFLVKDTKIVETVKLIQTIQKL